MYNGGNFMAFLLKLNLILLGIGFCFGAICFYLDREFLYSHVNRKKLSQELFEQAYLIGLKFLSLIYFTVLFATAFSTVIVSIYSIPFILSLPIEMAAGIMVLIAALTIGGVLALPAAFKRPIINSSLFLATSPTTEPALYNLAGELADHYNMPSISDIRITPGDEIRITEDICSIDDVFYGSQKWIEIGLCSLQFLTASDFKALLARQFAFYKDGNQSLEVIVKRLNRRLELMTDNLLAAGFIYTFNPVYLFVYLAQSFFSFITRDCALLAEIKADESAARWGGTNRLKNALARYNVEIENHRGLIEAISHSYSPVYESPENIFDVIRNAHREPNDRINKMAGYMFLNDDRQQKGIRQSLKLRLKRLPETPENEFETSHPAYDYLADWKSTENRMIDVLNKKVFF